MKKKVSITEVMKKDKDSKVLQKINSNRETKAIYDSMIKLEKIGIYFSDFECFRFSDFYTGEKNLKAVS